jgi:DNA-binding MarR family transcriptional regulator
VGKMTKAKVEYLAIIACGREMPPAQIARLLGKPISAVSRTRNRCLDDGLINSWARWNDMPSLTPAGRSALEEHNG